MKYFTLFKDKNWQNIVVVITTLLTIYAVYLFDSLFKNKFTSFLKAYNFDMILVGLIAVVWLYPKYKYFDRIDRKDWGLVIIPIAIIIFGFYWSYKITNADFSINFLDFFTFSSIGGVFFTFLGATGMELFFREYLNQKSKTVFLVFVAWGLFHFPRFFFPEQIQFTTVVFGQYFFFLIKILIVTYLFNLLITKTKSIYILILFHGFYNLFANRLGEILSVTPGATVGILHFVEYILLLAFFFYLKYNYFREK